MKLELESEKLLVFTEQWEQRKFCLSKLQQKCMVDQTFWVTKKIVNFQRLPFLQVED